MKTIVLLTALLTAGVCSPAFASEFQVSSVPTDRFSTLDELLARSRLSIGASRESVLTEMRDPNLVLHANVWVYTGFRASNVAGAERFDALLVTFKQDKVDTIRLVQSAQVRLAASRSALETTKVAAR
jgi:hypothetical protein